MDKSNKEIYMNETKMYIDKDGTKVYTNSKEKLHKLDGPAIEYVDGSKFWYKKGKCHRNGGPATELANGDKYWYKEGKWHRDDGPAYESVNRTKFWYKEGLRHRIDGPAIEYSNGERHWWVLNQYLEEKEFNSWISRIQKYI